MYPPPLTAVSPFSAYILPNDFLSCSRRRLHSLCRRYRSRRSLQLERTRHYRIYSLTRHDALPMLGRAATWRVSAEIDALDEKARVRAELGAFQNARIHTPHVPRAIEVSSLFFFFKEAAAPGNLPFSPTHPSPN